MPEIIIRYKSEKTLAILKDLAKTLDFFIFKSNETSKNKENELPIHSSEQTLDLVSLRKIFSGRNLESKVLRERAWNREK